MYTINGKHITLSRGDTMHIHLNLRNPDGTEYVPEEGDEIEFNVRRTYDDGVYIYKTIDNDTMEFTIESSDTESILYDRSNGYGDYVYDIVINYSTGDVFTVIDRGTLTITEVAH